MVGGVEIPVKQHYIPNQKSILRHPFPSEDDVRYPDVWLDISFAEIDRIKAADDQSAFSALQGYTPTLPPSLLYKLTEASIDALFKTPTAEIPAKVARAERLAYGFLSLLAKCDRSSLATEFILRIIIDRPDSSSWHRQLLTIPFLRSLSASQAKQLIRSFAEAITRKMKEKEDFSKQKATSTDGDVLTPKPFIKITTIKYLAQLTGGADFIPDDFGAEILGTLFETSAHIDVRVAIVGSLMEMLKECDETESSSLLGEKILKVLESTIPIAASLDERIRLGRKEWEIISESKRLPDVFEQGGETLDLCMGPIVSEIMNGISVKTKWGKRLFQQIILPILKQSIAENRRWLLVFTSKHGLGLDTLEIPILPVKPKFLKMIVSNHHDDIPASLMELYQNFILINMSPPPSIAALNKKLREDPKLRALQENKHWLSLYDHGPGTYNYNSFNMATLLRAMVSKQPGHQHNIPISQIQDYLSEQAKLLISLALPTQFEDFMNKLGPSFSGNGVITDAKPLGPATIVVERIIELIDSLRTPQWQRDLKRKPTVLPQSLKYRLCLLPYPVHGSNAKRSEDFVEELKGFLREICSEGNAYHENWSVVKKAAMMVQHDRRGEVGCLLGELKKEEKMGIADLLCVEIARDLFKAASWPKDEVVYNRAKKVMVGWRLSPIESVREKAFRM